jgi:A nuclease family of the HNH/ENDO VII superfamily with conserved AHH
VYHLQLTEKKVGGTLLTGGLTLAAFFAPEFAAPLLEGAALTGVATGLYELPQLTRQNLAAESAQFGGKKLTSLEREETRFKMAMGYTNIVMAGLDTQLGQAAIKGLTKIPGVVVAAAKLTAEQSRVFVASLARIKGEVTDAVVQTIAAGVRKADVLTTRTIVNTDGTLSQGGPLNQAAQKMDEVAAASAARTASAAKPIQLAEQLSDEAAEQLLEKYPQWDNVKDFVGKHLDPNNLPPGYSPHRKDGKIIELHRDSTEGPFPPLTIKNGVIELQTGQSSRLSVFSRYKKNYLDWVEQTQGKAVRTAAEQRLADGNQLHHLVPDAVVRDNLLTQELMSRSKKYTLDRGTNILDMPTIHDPKTGEIVHLGSHEKFNEYVDGLLNLEIRNLTGGGAIPLKKVKVNDIDKALRQVEDTLRDQITNHTLPKDILKELEGGGFGISEGIQDSQRGEIA